MRSLSGNEGCGRPGEQRGIVTAADQAMNDIIIISKSGERRKINRCLSCGTTEISGRRRYCSAYCRQRLGYKLDMRVGLVQALNVRYATFYFSDILIAMDMLTYGQNDIFSFFYPRSRNRTPAEDFSRMADILGEMWWTEQKRTHKRYLASRHVLAQAVRNPTPMRPVRPVQTIVPSLRGTSMTALKISRIDLMAPDLPAVIRDAYRRQAKIHHPDVGGDAETFRKIHDAYLDLMLVQKSHLCQTPRLSRQMVLRRQPLQMDAARTLTKSRFDPPLKFQRRSAGSGSPPESHPPGQSPVPLPRSSVFWPGHPARAFLSAGLPQIPHR